MPWKFPKVYPILDSVRIPSEGRTEFLRKLGGALTQAGVTLLEYRNKIATDDLVLADAATLRAAMPGVKLILDDRAHLVRECGFDGVHVDADDMSPVEARKLLGPDGIVGTFGGSDALLPGILDAPADYLAVGPVYHTTTKETSKSPIGPQGVRHLRQEAGPDRILTAAAGITFETAPLVLEAGASTVAVAAALFSKPDPAAEFKRWINALG